MEIVIFKDGRMIGPLAREEAARLLAIGEISENDLAQSDGVHVWVPVCRLLPAARPPTALERHAARTAGRLRAWSLKFWTALHFDPLRVGVGCVIAACALIVLAPWAFPLFVLLLVAGVFAGALLLTHGRIVSGIALSVGALAVPALFLVATSDRSSALAALRGEFRPAPHPSIAPIAQPSTPQPMPAKPSPPKELRGLGLPVPVPATPPPRPAVPL